MSTRDWTHHPEIITKTITESAKIRIRDKYKEFLMRELEPEIEKMVDEFCEEFQHDITAYLQQSARSFLPELIVEVRKR